MHRQDASAMRRFLVLFLLCAFPLSAAAEGAVTRRDGFLRIWEGISRSTDETRETPFADVPEGTEGFAVITYAKARGILDGDDGFRPDDPLLLSDAVLWLLRTRNTADPEEMTPEALPVLLAQYPFIEQARDLSEPVASSEALLALANALDTMLAEEVHEVSLYSEKFHGKGTAFGETFDMHALTAAHRTFPWNTLVKVTNVENGQSVTVRINDRGPYVEGRDMDLSLASFLRIAPRSQGVARATFRRLGDAALVDSCSGDVRRYQKRITRDVRFHRGIPHTTAFGEPLTLGANRAFVVRSVTYPDGTVERFEDWVLPEETFTLTPGVPGLYVFRVSTADGRSRTMRMEVWECQ
ncbi:MAG: septal ring lytic transglycosylase RlpA family protein [Candidatus Peribacteraceae bacterium]|nr:septal ring lytic transglycosylase RlpA family protein [Candidatus Peribacteraceae bacterium]